MTAATEYATKIAPKSHTMDMRCKGFLARLMQAPRLRDIGRAHSLPPGNPVPIYPIDALPGCPDDWVREAGSYVCPVDPEWGLWFDFTMNDHENTAVIASVKGMNPITGRKLENLSLEKYSERCPVHSIPFTGDKLFCKECGYKWPAQSYLSYPNILWWDGFRQADGTVRQFFFSEEEERDVASAVIGKKNTVPAFGFVFYEPKVRRVTKLVRSRGGSQVMGYASKGPGGSSAGGSGWMNASSHYGVPVSMPLSSQVDIYHSEEKTSMKLTNDSPSEFTCRSLSDVSIRMDAKCDKKSTSRFLRGKAPEQVYLAATAPEPEKEVSVGAGAEIRQDLVEDTTPLSDWKEQPTATIRLYFVFRKKFERIVNKGLVDLDGNKEGYLKGLPVG